MTNDPDEKFITALTSFLDALEEWGFEDNAERAAAILDFQRCGYDLEEYLEEAPERSRLELN